MFIKYGDWLEIKSNLTVPQRGVVKDNNDPKKLGRVKVVIKDFLQGIDTYNLPWIYPISSAFQGGRVDLSTFAVPEVNSELIVIFPYDEIYFGFYIGYWQSDITHPIIFNEYYPNEYGSVDSTGFWYRINKADVEEKGHPSVELYHHFSDSMIRLDRDGNIWIKNPGDVTWDVGGDLNISVGGKLVGKIGGEINFKTSKDIAFETSEKIGIKADKTIRLESVEDFEIKSKDLQLKSTNIYLDASADIKEHSVTKESSISGSAKMESSDFNVKTSGDINLKAGTKANVEGTSEVNILSTGLVKLHGSGVHKMMGAGPANAPSVPFTPPTEPTLPLPDLSNLEDKVQILEDRIATLEASAQLLLDEANNIKEQLEKIK